MKKRLVKIKKLFITGFLASSLFLLCILASIVYHANVENSEKSDVILVLGCQVWQKSPSWTLQYRLEKALELYQKDMASYIIVSGGQGNDEIASEASVMKSWLVAHGVEEKAIFMENQSTSTYENLKFSKKVMEEHQFKTAIVVSNGFHIFRALSLSSKVGIKASGAPAQTVTHLIPYYYGREVLAVVKSLILYSF